MPEDGLDLIKDVAENSQFENVFSTPIFSHLHTGAETLNTQLRDLILEIERTDRGVVRSNQGGWQSTPDFLRSDSPPIATLERYIVLAIKIATLRVTAQPNLKFRIELHGWAAVNRNGHYNTTHVHPMATWSGVYYVDPGDQNPDAPDGLLEFVHPIAASVMTFLPSVLPSARLVQPKAGMLILFPSYLQHNVRMYRGRRPRICVPFNAHLQYG
jgi:uncharacterized protein (TIGR02466 family)